VDKPVDIAKLQLDCGPYIVETNHVRKLLNDLEPAFQVPQMVIRHLQDKEIFENTFVNHLPHTFPACDNNAPKSSILDSGGTTSN
jgi:hypothetical protein